MSERLKGLIVVVLTLSVCALASEIFLRFFFPQDTLDRLRANSPAIYRTSDLLPYELQPFSKGRLKRQEFDTTVTINSMGYRERDFNVKKEGRFRILVIGDSFTFGFGVEGNEGYPARIEKILANDYHQGSIEVINAGFASGHNPDTYYLYLKEKGLKLNVDLILVGFFVGNDIVHYRHSAVEHEWTRTDQEGLPLQIRNVASEVENGRWVRKKKRLIYAIPVLRNSHLFHLLVSSARGLAGYFRSEHSRIFETTTPSIYQATYSDNIEQAIQQTQTLFRAMARLAAKNGIPLAVVMIPAREQVYSADLKSPELRQLDWTKPQRIFAAFFSREHIPYLDLLPPMRQGAKDADFYFRYDLHWNAKGHEFAARATSTFLVENNLLRASKGARGALAFSLAS